MNMIQDLPSFIEYDIFRLFKYSIRKENIEAQGNEDLVLLYFSEVGYFNYLFIRNSQITEYQILNSFSNFKNKGLDTIKIILSKHFGSSSLSLFVNPEDLKTISYFKKEISTKPKTDSNCHLKLIEKKSDLILYATFYLRCFQSEKTNYAEVAENFELLMDSAQCELFFILNGNQVVGFCSNFYSQSYCLLAACGILEEYRNLGFQKNAINERMKRASEKGYTDIRVWAYQNSISYHNLLKSNFQLDSEYYEYVSQPLGNFTKASSLLQGETFCNKR